MKGSSLARLLVVPVVLLAAAMACNLPGAAPALDSGLAATQTIQALATAVAATLQSAEGAAPVEAPGATATVEPGTPAPTATPSLTPSITPTATPAVPVVQVSQNTNCRSGPGKVYDLLGALLKGEQAVVLGRTADSTYWYIENPDRPGGSCWLWGRYASVSGDTVGLPVLTPPPTPTSTLTPTATAVPLDFAIQDYSVTTCGPNIYLNFLIKNTGSVPLESSLTTATDLDLSETRSWTRDQFLSSTSCIGIVVGSLAPGATAYLASGPFSSPHGHTVRVTIKACAQDGLGGACAEKSRDFAIAAPSDASFKENRRPVDEEAVLERLMRLSITTWNYREMDEGARHIGPMAQEFNELFGVGADPRYISVVDAQGVAFASIQALNERVQAQEARLAELERQVAESSNRARSAWLLPVLLGFLAGAAGAWGWVGLRARRRRGGH